MSAVLAALRHADKDENSDRPYLIELTMRYGRKVIGAVASKIEDVAADGGIAIVIWENDEETDRREFFTISDILWCHINWLD
jgi:uncharacterized protein Veg